MASGFSLWSWHQLRTNATVLALSVLITIVLGAGTGLTQSSNARISSNRKALALKEGHKLSPGTQYVIYYGGGPVMGGPTNVYVIYYGNWGSINPSLIDTWLSNLGGSSLYGITTTYYDSTGAGVQNVLHYNSSTNSYDDAGSQGNNLTDSSVQTIVSDAISGGYLPADENGVYFVLTGLGVTVTSSTGQKICGDFIGYHWVYTYTNPINGDQYNTKYAVVANVAGCRSWDGNVMNGDSTTPNGHIAADGTINWMFHELAESVTDPEPGISGAWGDLPNNGGFAEVGDKCENNFGTWSSLPTAGNGAHYNVTIAGVNYLIQQLFQVAGGIPTAGDFYAGSCEIGRQPVTALVSSLNPSLVGQTVTFTATVKGLDGGTPTGTVTFYKNGIVLGTVPLSGGQASIGEVFGTTGTRSITAAYSGDANYTSSASPVLSQVVTDTTTSLVSSPNPSMAGQSVLFTATVTPQFGGTPTGTVTFTKNGTIVLGTAPLSGGQANLKTSFAQAGTKSITATYSGDTNYTPSTSPVLYQVNQATTTTSLASSVNPSIVGQSVTFTATVTGGDGGTPTGTVTFKNGSVVLGTAPLSSGQAGLSTAFAGVGTQSITAAYSGDANYTPSTSQVLNQVVNQASSTTSLTSSPNPSTVGQSVTFTATVTPQFGGTPTGTVTFYKNATVSLGTVPLSGGQAMLSVGFTGPGTKPITAAYSGDTNYTPSTSPVLYQVVN